MVVRTFGFLVRFNSTTHYSIKTSLKYSRKALYVYSMFSTQIKPKIHPLSTPKWQPVNPNISAADVQDFISEDTHPVLATYECSTTVVNELKAWFGYRMHTDYFRQIKSNAPDYVSLVLKQLPVLSPFFGKLKCDKTKYFYEYKMKAIKKYFKHKCAAWEIATFNTRLAWQNLIKYTKKKRLFPSIFLTKLVRQKWPKGFIHWYTILYYGFTLIISRNWNDKHHIFKIFDQWWKLIQLKYEKLLEFQTIKYKLEKFDVIYNMYVLLFYNKATTPSYTKLRTSRLVDIKPTSFFSEMNHIENSQTFGYKWEYLNFIKLIGTGLITNSPNSIVSELLQENICFYTKLWETNYSWTIPDSVRQQMYDASHVDEDNTASDNLYKLVYKYFFKNISIFEIIEDKYIESVAKQLDLTIFSSYKPSWFSEFILANRISNDNSTDSADDQQELYKVLKNMDDVSIFPKTDFENQLIVKLYEVQAGLFDETNEPFWLSFVMYPKLYSFWVQLHRLQILTGKPFHNKMRLLFKWYNNDVRRWMNENRHSQAFYYILDKFKIPQMSKWGRRGWSVNEARRLR